MQKTKKYLPVSEQELRRIEEYKQRNAGVKVDAEQLFIAEFGKHFGFEGIMAILENKIDSETATWLVAGARKVDSGRLYDMARASFIGNVSCITKNPGTTFSKQTAGILRDTKANNG